MSQNEESDQRLPLSIPSAEELKEAGIVFKPKGGKKKKGGIVFTCKKKKKRKGGSFLSIKFQKKGVIKIPHIYFSDGLDSVFQNFVAFELCCSPNARKFFVGYVLFMDCIINSGKDVKILRDSGVLEHGFGSDEELANVINQMSRGVYFDAKNTPIAEQYKGINDYSKARCNVWRAILVHDYFNTPWAIISFLAALFLLILTVTQTFFTIFPRN